MVFSNQETKKLTAKIENLDKLLHMARQHGRELEILYQQCLTMKMQRQQERQQLEALQQQQGQQSDMATTSGQSAMDIFESMTCVVPATTTTTTIENVPSTITTLPEPMTATDLLNIRLDLSVPTRSHFQQEEEEEDED